MQTPRLDIYLRMFWIFALLMAGIPSSAFSRLLEEPQGATALEKKVLTKTRAATSSPRKVLMLYSSMGGGHISAAKG